MNRYIGLDTETGGVTLDTSLLTVFLGIFDENFQLVSELYLRVKPDDYLYHVTAEAMSINKIDLVEHDKKAVYYKEAKTILYQFLQKNYQHEKLIPIGHGVNFDLIRIKQNLISQGSWENFVSYRSLDTSIVAQYLRAAKIFPDDVSGSLGSLVSYFGLPSQGELHDARVDTLQTVSVLVQLLKLITPITEIKACP